MSFDIKHEQLPHSQISAHHRILPSVINATGKQLRPRTTHNSSTSYEQCVSPTSSGSALPTRHPSRTPHRQRIQCLQQVESTCQRPDRVHNMSRHTGISSCDPAALNPRITSPKSRHVHAVDAHNILTCAMLLLLATAKHHSNIQLRCSDTFPDKRTSNCRQAWPRNQLSHSSAPGSQQNVSSDPARS